MDATFDVERRRWQSTFNVDGRVNDYVAVKVNGGVNVNLDGHVNPNWVVADL